MRYLELPPHPTLTPHVRCYWFLEGRGSSGPEAPTDPVLPDGCPELVLNLGDPAVYQSTDGPTDVQPSAMLVGQITRPFAFEPGLRIDFVGVRFTPAGAHALLGLPMHEITDGYVDADGLWPRISEARSRLSEISAPRGVAVCLDAALRDRLARRRAEATAVSAAASLIEKSGGGLTVDGLAGAVGLSARQLARRFREEVGIGPKHLSRIRRFQTVLRLLNSPGISLAEAALASGYYDQAHLTRDFRELAGASPAAFLSCRHPLAEHFTGAPLSGET